MAVTNNWFPICLSQLSEVHLNCPIATGQVTPNLTEEMVSTFSLNSQTDGACQIRSLIKTSENIFNKHIDFLDWWIFGLHNHMTLGSTFYQYVRKLYGKPIMPLLGSFPRHRSLGPFWVQIAFFSPMPAWTTQSMDMQPRSIGGSKSSMTIFNLTWNEMKLILQHHPFRPSFCPCVMSSGTPNSPLNGCMSFFVVVVE